MLQQQKRRRVGKSLYNWWYHTTRFDNQTTCSFFFLVTEGLLASLHTLFPLQSVTALDLIDHRSVSLLTSPSGDISSKKKPHMSFNNFKLQVEKSIPAQEAWVHLTSSPILDSLVHVLLTGIILTAKTYGVHIFWPFN